MNTKLIGQITETRFIFEATRSGHVVSQPFGDNSKYDFILDMNDELYKVQCKTLRKTKGVYKIQCYSITSSGNHGYNGSVDYIFAYCAEDDVSVMIPMSEIGDTQEINLRIEKPNNNQTKGIRLVENHLSSKILDH